jgi:hypothetical protein
MVLQSGDWTRAQQLTVKETIQLQNETQEFWSESLKERDYSEDLGVDGRITLQYNLQK